MESMKNDQLKSLLYDYDSVTWNIAEMPCRTQQGYGTAITLVTSRLMVAIAWQRDLVVPELNGDAQAEC